MVTKYWIRQRIIGPQVQIPINVIQYNSILDAADILLDAQNLEERYEMILGNFLDLERFFSEYTIESQLRYSFKYESAAVAFMNANRRVMNLLTTFKSYIDQTPRDFKKINKDFKNEFNIATSAAYDNSKAYRFIYALRNHVQHHSSPVHKIEGASRSKPWPDQTKFLCLKDQLMNNKDFKRIILNDMEDEIDLTLNIREFIQELSSIHISLRTFIEEHAASARKLFEQNIAHFISAQSEPTKAVGLSICKEIDGKYVDEHPILLDWDDARLQLIEKNKYSLRMVLPTA